MYHDALNFEGKPIKSISLPTGCYDSDDNDRWKLRAIQLARVTIARVHANAPMSSLACMLVQKRQPRTADFSGKHNRNIYFFVRLMFQTS